MAVNEGPMMEIGIKLQDHATILPWSECMGNEHKEDSIIVSFQI